MEAGTTERCAWCTEAEVRIASQAFRILDLMDHKERLEARNQELLRDNRRLRLALGHPRPPLAAVRIEEGTL